MLRRLKHFVSKPTKLVDVSPLDRLISLWLRLANDTGGKAIVIGKPLNVPASVLEEREAEYRNELASEMRTPNPLLDVKSTQALQASSRLRSAAGWSRVPVWMERDGQLHLMEGLSFGLHLTFLYLLQERLLSLNASEQAPQPMRYIEYDSVDPNHRCFAEVELLFMEDNTIRLEILRHLREPLSVRVARSVD